MPVSDKGAQFRAVRDALILSDYRLGESIKHIAIQTNLSDERVRQILRKAGITFRRPGTA